ncbi:hypothetical protein [Haloferula sp.]|uniref:hypothetical protein n=1 Tax=Haloferula sp. TaxID=2497595 RepID=UPI0032A0FB82
MRWLTSLSLVLILAGCADRASQALILTRAKQEVANRENWGDQAYIRVEKKPRHDYVMWRDRRWVVSAGAYDYASYPVYNGTRVISGTERELVFTRDGCLTEYNDKTSHCRGCHSLEPAPEPVYSAPIK